MGNNQKRNSVNQEGEGLHSRKQGRNSGKNCTELPKEIEYSGNKILKKIYNTKYKCNWCEKKYKKTIGYTHDEIYRCLDCVTQGLIIDSTDLHCLNTVIRKMLIFNSDNFNFNENYIDNCYLCKKSINNKGVIYKAKTTRPIYCLMCILTRKEDIVKSHRKK